MIARVVSCAALATCIAAVDVPKSASAQSPVTWSALSPERAVPRGAPVHVTLKVTIAPGWHVYSLTQPPGGPIALRITVPAGQALSSAGSAQGPLPDVENDPNFGIQVETYSHEAEFTVPLRAAPTAPTGPTIIQIAARYQACNATLCLPPQTKHLAVSVNVAPR